MCGIFGYIGNKNTAEVLLDGLKELEYRGYDSAGLALLNENNIDVYKALGKLENLRKKTKDIMNKEFYLGIGHTRWATHGKPTELNAHPHLGEYSYVVHNGIIENYKELKDDLISQGHKFVSQTDTEVIVHLFENINNKINDTKQAFKDTISKLKGAFSILLVSKADPKKIFFFKHGSPLIIAKGNEQKEILFSSSDAPLIGLCKKVVYLEDGVGGIASADDIEFFDDNYTWSSLPSSKQYAQKDGFRFFMEKEIYEQSDVVSDCMLERVKDETTSFDEINDAGITSSYLFERLSKIKCNVEIASEFRYKQPLLTKDTLFIVISQSGETADTLEVLKMAKNAGLKQKLFQHKQ
jgi:glucosamine--fructose-6-phosphate aminotransferase (isomerizing)